MSKPIPLSYPFKNAAGVEVKELHVQRRLKRKDMTDAHRYSPNDSAAQEDFLLAVMTGVTVEEIAELDVADAAKVNQRFREMVGDTGGAAIA